MKTMNSSLRALLVTAACLCGSAYAQNITFTVVRWDPSYQVNGTFTDGDTQQGGQIVDYASGLLEITAYNTGGNQNDSFMFNALCVEPTDAFGGALLYQGAALSGLPNYQQVAKLVGGYLQNVGTATNPGQETAAVQWAIWEVVAELSPTFSVAEGEGNVYITPGNPNSGIDPDSGKSRSQTDLEVINRATYYLANINNFSPAQNLVYLTSNGNQDVVTWNIPEPGTAGLLALSVFGLLRRRR